MLNLRSYYRVNLDEECETSRSGKEEDLRVGICDYIPQEYFSRQYFSVYIEGITSNQIIESILWNQYYEKTLLKEIYAQLATFKRKNEDSLIAKLDNMLSKSTNITDLIYLKIASNVYNLKEKLEYSSMKELEKEIKQNQSLTIEKITQEGKWKKVFISFAPYENKEQIDIIFSLNPTKNIIPLRKTHSEIKNYSDQINETEMTKTATEIKPKKSVRKNSTQSEKNFYKNLQSSTNKKKSPEKDISFSNQETKSKAKNRGPSSSHRKSSTTIEKLSNSQKKLEENSQDISQNENISNFLEKSLKKKNLGFECNPSESDVLKEIHFNNTTKLELHNFDNVNGEEVSQPVSMDLRRKQTLKVKQNSVMNDEKMFNCDSQTIKNSNDQIKNNSVLAQILSKKEETIQSQKRKMEEMEQKHLKEIEELKLKHLTENELNKNEITKILNEYKKKYDNEKEISKKLRAELTSLQQVLSENKVIIAELQITCKFNEEEASRFKEESFCLKGKLSEIEEKYNHLLLKSQQEQTKIISEKDKAQSLADKYIKKYNNLAKKLRIIAQEEDQEEQS